MTAPPPDDRAEVLGRIRAALGSPAGAPGEPGGTGGGPRGPAGPRAYRTASDLGMADLVSLLSERLADYGCAVHRVRPREVPAAVTAALSRRGTRRVVIPPGLGPGSVDLGALGGHGVEVVTDDGLSPRDLDAFDGVITTAAVAIAETGTIVLDGSLGQGRRVLSLVPDYHLCILSAEQIVHLVPEAIARLSPVRPLTWISGPSATSDIELERVAGVHGPRTLEIIVAMPDR